MTLDIRIARFYRSVTYQTMTGEEQINDDVNTRYDIRELAMFIYPINMPMMHWKSAGV